MTDLNITMAKSNRPVFKCNGVEFDSCHAATIYKYQQRLKGVMLEFHRETMFANPEVAEAAIETCIAELNKLQPTAGRALHTQLPVATSYEQLCNNIDYLVSADNISAAEYAWLQFYDNNFMGNGPEQTQAILFVQSRIDLHRNPSCIMPQSGSQASPPRRWYEI